MEENAFSDSHPSPERTQETVVTPVTSQVLSPVTAQVLSPVTAQVLSPVTAQVLSPVTPQVLSPVRPKVLSPCTRITRSKFSSVLNVPKIIKIKKKVLDQPHVHSQLEGFPVKARKGRPPKIKKALEIE